MTSKKQGKTHVTPKKSPTNKQADTLLRQIRTENAIKDLAKSNKKMGIVTAPSSSSLSTTTTPTTTTTTQATTAKSKKK